MDMHSIVAIFNSLQNNNLSATPKSELTEFMDSTNSVASRFGYVLPARQKTVGKYQATIMSDKKGEHFVVKILDNGLPYRRFMAAGSKELVQALKDADAAMHGLDTAVTEAKKDECTLCEDCWEKEATEETDWGWLCNDCYEIRLANETDSFSLVENASVKKLAPKKLTIGKKPYYSFVQDINAKKELGMVIRGAGGKLSDWVNGISKMLQEESIVESSPVFSEAYVISENAAGKDGRTDLVVWFSPTAKVNIGRLAMWRLQMGNISWTDDFIVNYGKDYGTSAYEELDEGTVACHQCNDEKVVPCQVCNGHSGNSSCKECQGTGEIDCRKCNSSTAQVNDLRRLSGIKEEVHHANMADFDADVEEEGLYCDRCGSVHAGKCFDDRDEDEEIFPSGELEETKSPDFQVYETTEFDADLEDEEYKPVDIYCHGKCEERGRATSPAHLDGDHYTCDLCGWHGPLEVGNSADSEFDTNLDESKRTGKLAKLRCSCGKLAKSCKKYEREEKGHHDSGYVAFTNTLSTKKSGDKNMNEALTPKRENSGLNGAPRGWKNSPQEQIAGWRAVIDDADGPNKPKDMFNNFRGGDNQLKVVANKKEEELHEDTKVAALATTLHKKFLNAEKSASDFMKPVAKSQHAKKAGSGKVSESTKQDAKTKADDGIKFIKQPSKEVQLAAAKHDDHEFKFIKGSGKIAEGAQRELSVPEKHQLRIARDTVKNPDKALLGGPSVEEAKKIIAKLTSKKDQPKKKVKESSGYPEWQTREDELAAVKQDGNAIRFMQQPSKEVQKAAISYQVGQKVLYANRPAIITGRTGQTVDLKSHDHSEIKNVSISKLKPYRTIEESVGEVQGFDITDVKLDNVTQVYSGLDGACCCGCKGKHSYATKYVNDEDVNPGYDVSDSVNDKEVNRIYSIMQKNAGNVELDKGLASQYIASLVSGRRLYLMYFYKPSSLETPSEGLIDELKDHCPECGNDSKTCAGASGIACTGVIKKRVAESLTPAGNATVNRLSRQNPELINKYGFEAVKQAVEAVTEHLTDLEEIGSSDVSAWANQTIEELEHQSKPTSADPAMERFNKCEVCNGAGCDTCFDTGRYDAQTGNRDYYL